MLSNHITYTYTKIETKISFLKTRNIRAKKARQKLEYKKYKAKYIIYYTSNHLLSSTIPYLSY